MQQAGLSNGSRAFNGFSTSAESNGFHTTHEAGSTATPETSTYEESEPIAVIGFDIKFPGEATDAESFFEMLKGARSAFSEVPSDRYNQDAFYHPDADRAGAMNVRHAHFIKEDIGAFDAPFFSLTPAEASQMDPQQRGLLETVYRALENAGIPMSKAAGSKTSVYVGCFTREYEAILSKDPEMNHKYMATGTGTAMLSNRLSWFYDLRGPSLTIDTACSSSLNACHLAVNSLRTGESSMALVGGCNLFYQPDTTVALTSLGFLSADGKCYSFDHRANGYSRGEGFGILVLKRLSDAIRDQDTIRSVIRGTASNQDGRSPGITQPTMQAQVELIHAAYENAGLKLDGTRFFEAHGTGTPVGDPLEAKAISNAFTKHRSNEEPLYIGAVKSNIGHLEGAAGIAGLVKTILVLERGVIPPNINYEKPNPQIRPEEWNLSFPTESIAWPTNGLRRASINSFGYGGSNAHVVMEDAANYLKIRQLRGNHRTIERPQLKGSNGYSQTSLNGTNGNHLGANGKQHNEKKLQLFTFSSSDEAGIGRLMSSYREHLLRKAPLISDEASYLASLSYTLSCKRSSFIWKSTVIADSLASLTDALGGPAKVSRSSGQTPKLGFIFTGQGAQWFGMGRELINVPVFKQSLEDAEVYLKSIGCSWSLSEELSKDEDKSLVHKPAISQPACAALQIALIDLLRSWDIYPDSVIGHSSGEIAAAFALGAISRQSALKIAYYRGLLSTKLVNSAKVRGGMMSVGLSPEDAQAVLSEKLGPDSGNVAIACFNSPKNVTLSGLEKDLDDLKTYFDLQNIFARKLKVDNAYHSKYMEPIAAEYAKLLGNIEPDNETSKRMAVLYSTVSGQPVSPEQLRQPSYWVSNMVSPVRFSDALASMCSTTGPKTKKLGAQAQKHEPITHLLEIGPSSALRGPTREITKQSSEMKHIEYESVLKRKESALETSLNAAGWLYCCGYSVNVEAANARGNAHDTAQLVDLPNYPFNHSKSYWSEGRLSKNFRFRKHIRHELLGAAVPDWDPSEACWRNYIRLSENPWISDHRITGSTLYPGAGMLVMAIEASRQLLNPDKKLKGFRIREAVFHMALRVPSTAEGIETHFYLRPYRDSTASTASPWNEFKLCSYEDGEWKENCRGLITTEYEDAVTAVDGGLENKYFVETCVATHAELSQECQTKVDFFQLYEHFSNVGLDFGSTFQNLREVRCSDELKMVASIKTPDIKGMMAESYIQPHLIHPTTLDAVLQGSLVALSKGGVDIRSVMVPQSIGDLWISGDLVMHPEDMLLGSSSKYHGFRQAESTNIVLDSRSQKPLITLEKFVVTAVSGHDAGDDDEYRHMCFNIDWKPDPSFLDQELAQKILTAPIHTPPQPPKKVIGDLEFLCYAYIKRAMRLFDPERVPKLRPSYQKYVKWMMHQLERYESGEIPHSTSEWSEMASNDHIVEQIALQHENSTSDGTLVVTVGKNLLRILNEEVDFLELLFGEKRVENLYRHGIGADIGYEKLTGYLDTLAHKNPALKILEIGAGTGGATLPILESLTRDSVRFGHYTFTDISAGFFEAAKEVFAFAADRMTFQTLDIERDSEEQGFETKYDVIIAANVLHATKNLEATLSNCKKLLKPGGKIILHEMTNPAIIRPGFLFGPLPGWWLPLEEFRQWGPLISIEDWSMCFRRAGFNGIDIALSDFPGEPEQLVSTLVSTVRDDTPPSPFPSITIIQDFKGIVAENLKRGLQDMGASCTVTTFSHLDTAALAGAVCIFLPELEGSVLKDITATDFAKLQSAVATASGFLWLTNGGGASSTNPEAELCTGFARCMRAENPGLNFVTLSVDELTSSSETSHAALEVLTEVFARNNRDNSFYLKDGIINISRVIEAEYMNQALEEKTQAGKARPCAFGEDPSRALMLNIGTPGLLDTLQFDDDPTYPKPLLAGQVEIKIKATGLNLLDIVTSLGQVQEAFLGVECAGIVSRVGEGVDFKVGDRVFGIAKGSFKTYARASHQCISKIPDGIPFAVAASLPIVYCTVYYAFHNVANIKRGETVLIHWGAGGVGQAAIQLAKLAGAEIFTTVGSVEKRNFLIDTYGIPHDHIFSSRDLTFAQGIRRMTKNRGVDICLNSMAGRGLRESWDLMAPFGRFLEIGKVDVYSSARLSMNPFKKSVTFSFVDLSFMADVAAPVVSDVLDNIARLASEGAISECKPLHTYSYSQIQEAFRFMQGGTHIGKIVLEAHEDDIVMATPNRNPTYNFDPNATYVISGGMGGLGRSTASWMASRGARNLLILSRSGTTRESAKQLCTELEAMGVTVWAPKCDVTDENVLRATLDSCQRFMPPIKGCIQGSMVLKDSIFANMSISDYETAVKPKVHASGYLHQLLPKDLDFFILLSSASGIVGNRGQANYCVGNTYQDALARYRVTNGLKGYSIDLGMILSVGFAAENSELITSLRAAGFNSMREDEYRAVLDILCDPNRPLPLIHEAQLTLSIENPETLRIKGIEEPAWMHDPLFCHLYQIRSAGTEAAENETVNYGALLGATHTLDEATAVAIDAIVGKLCKALSVREQDVDTTKPLHLYGVDSLVAVELRTWFMKELGASVAVFDIMSSSSIKILAALVAKRSSYVSSAEAEAE